MEPETLEPRQDGDDLSQTAEVKTHVVGNRTFIVADVEPLDVDGIRTIAVGAGLWLLAFVLLLPFYGSLEESNNTWWLWTCIAGFGLGMFGVEYCRRRKRAREATGPRPSRRR